MNSSHVSTVDEIREHHARVTPGPWAWFGNTDVRDIYLASRNYGRMFVMLFRRWGMQGAEPVFAQGRAWKPEPKSMYDFDDWGEMTPARQLARYEVAPTATDRQDPRVYRGQIDGIRNPDAEFIANSWEYVNTLLHRVDQLEARLAAARSHAGEPEAGSRDTVPPRQW